MSRYIDADKVIEAIKNYGKGAIEDGYKILDPVDDIVLIVGLVDFIPTADVAPRAEVAREIFEEIESEIVAALQSNYRVKQERVEKQLPDDFVSYMCEGKIAALRGIGAFVEELKNKYSEGRNDT